MNKTRRKAIEDIIAQLEEQKSAIETAQNEEQEAYDNLPDGIQCTERGEAMSENADDLEQAASDLDDVISSLQDIIDR